MSTAGLDRLAALLAVAEARPELAGRVAELVDPLGRIRPLAGNPSWERADDAVAGLRRLGVVDEPGPAGGGDRGLSLSALAHRALVRALAPDLGPPRWEVGNRVVALAEALGRAFEPSPPVLLGVFRGAPAHEPDFREQVAWLAGRRGADSLVDHLASELSDDPEPVLDFLGAVADADRADPYRGSAPPEADPSTGEVPAVVVPSAERPPTRGVPSPPSVARPQGRPPGPTAPPDRGGVVSTGFANEVSPTGLPADRILAAGRRYRFWMEVAPELTADAIDTSAPRLPDLPTGTVLQVALFGFEGELRPVAGSDVGELRLVGGGRAVVVGPAGELLGASRLFLPVDTPGRPGRYRMRCNLYCRQALLQSRIVEVEVGVGERPAGRPVLSSELDFAVVSELRPEHLLALEARTLSLLVNDNGNGTHGFRFFAGREFKHDTILTGVALGASLEQARAGLRLASWATPDEPTRQEFAALAYRYEHPTPDVLAEDLTTLARSGFTVWDVLVDQLSGGDVADLVERMRAPGVVEVANRQSLDLLLPAACLYDHPLDVLEDRLTVCPAFVAARGVTPLAGTPCFQGRCPSYDDPTVVCPSGFWGFRHEIGYSASLTGGDVDGARDQALAIPGGAAPVFTVGASADAGLTRRDPHLERLRALAGGRWNFAWSRTDLFSLFRSVAPSVVYLYGHGGRQGQTAFFEVGSGGDGPIVRASLRGKADWRATRPLVFLNGCHSAALAPDAAFSYATGFLQTAHASAVVGTEIAVFEGLAVAFAEECLRRFVVDRQPLGRAVRGARLALLEQGVPLGLVYLAFGPTELHLAA